MRLSCSRMVADWRASASRLPSAVISARYEFTMIESRSASKPWSSFTRAALSSNSLFSRSIVFFSKATLFVAAVKHSTHSKVGQLYSCFGWRITLIILKFSLIRVWYPDSFLRFPMTGRKGIFRLLWSLLKLSLTSLIMDFGSANSHPRLPRYAAIRNLFLLPIPYILSIH